jgi:hypothetical protein
LKRWNWKAPGRRLRAKVARCRSSAVGGQRK